MIPQIPTTGITLGKNEGITYLHVPCDYPLCCLAAPINLGVLGSAELHKWASLCSPSQN